MGHKRMQAIVSGRVQGVGFRYFAVHVAHRLGLSGTVRNLPGGDVEAIAEGDEAVLGEFVAELRSGPSTAQVDDVRVAWGEALGERGGQFTAVS